MAQYHMTITVTLKSEILDPAGEATERVLHQMGYAVSHMRLGRHIALTVEAESSADAERLAGQMAHDLLANPVMETYQVRVEDL